MMNNDILRSLRYTFDIDDQLMVKIFKLSGKVVSRQEVCAWLKREEDPDFIKCTNKEILDYLDGFILYKRGPSDRNKPETDQALNNNIILKKIKIALNLKSDDLISILKLSRVNISQHELSAFFRNKHHKNFRNCNDQFLRQLLKGLQLTYRPNSKIRGPLKKISLPPQEKLIQKK